MLERVATLAVRGQLPSFEKLLQVVEEVKRAESAPKAHADGTFPSELRELPAVRKKRPMTVYTSAGEEVTYFPEDVVNTQDYIPTGKHNPHNIRPWRISDRGDDFAIAYADSEECALHISQRTLANWIPSWCRSKTTLKRCGRVGQRNYTTYGEAPSAPSI